MTAFLQILVPSVISLIGVILGAWWLRRSQKEKNQIDSGANDTSAFQVVTDQLFKLNNALREDLESLKQEVQTLKEEIASKEQTITVLESDLEDTDRKWRFQIDVTRQLANYIRVLISNWPNKVGPPPVPDPPMDWAVHL